MSRLEETKRYFERLCGFYPDEDSLREKVEYLIQQAERVQELEEDLLELVKQNKELRKSIAFYSSESYNAHLERLLDRSEKQNKRYREAIESMKSEINYALHSKKGKDVKRHYLENAIKYADKALEGEE